MTPAARLRRIRLWIAIFIVGLVLSGLTAFPLQHELDLLARMSGVTDATPNDGSLRGWIGFVHAGLRETYQKYPFIAYGTDWLGFAHLILAALFVGPYRDPVRNKFIIEFGLFACAAILPLALIAGPIRGIPFRWQMIDCSFAVGGAIPLWIARRHTIALTCASDPLQRSGTDIR